MKLSDALNYFNKTRFVNRCVLTNGKAKYNQTFKIFSRFSFLKLARSGTINGIEKAVREKGKKDKKYFEHGRTRTCNLPLRRRTRYPLRHAPDLAEMGRISRIEFSRFKIVEPDLEQQ